MLNRWIKCYIKGYNQITMDFTPGGIIIIDTNRITAGRIPGMTYLLFLSQTIEPENILIIKTK